MQLITTAILAFAASFTSASPLKRATLDIWSPRIVSPDATTVWVGGSTVNVTWDTSDAPVVITNQAGITLNKGDHVGNEGLLKEFGSFSLLDGSVEVTVPKVPAGDDYSITLFGDSGNSSPQFTITV